MIVTGLTVSCLLYKCMKDLILLPESLKELGHLADDARAACFVDLTW